MGGDREFFSDCTSSYRNWKTEKEILLPGESTLCTADVNIPYSGTYYLQFIYDYGLDVKIENVSYQFGQFPMMHNEIFEAAVELEKGKQTLHVRLTNNNAAKEFSGKFSARLLNDQCNIVFSGEATPLSEILPSTPLADRPDLSAYTPGAGDAFHSFGRFGFTKGDGVLDFSMPSFGIISRPYVSGHPQYHKNLIWNFSFLPDGEMPTGSLHTTYHVPENETIKNDWSGVCWTRRLKNGKSITFDYSVLSPVLLVETDSDYFNLSSLALISAWKKITLPLADGLHIRDVEYMEDDLCYNKATDGPLSRNYVLFSSQGTFPDVPLQFILKSSPEKIRVIRDRKGNIDGFRFEFSGPVDYLMMLFPCGIELFQPHEITEDKIIDWCNTLCGKYAQRALARPVSCTDYYKVTQDNTEIIQEFTYRIFEDEWNTPALYYAPLPPPLSIAEEHVPEIKLDPCCTREKFPTKYGYLYGVEHAAFSSYEIPVPDAKRELAFPEKNHEELQRKLEEDFDAFMSYHLDSAEVGNPGNYSFVFQYSFILMVFHLLSAEKRKRLEEVIKKGLKIVCDPSCSYIGPGKRKCYSWYNRKEPFSGLDFNMTYLHVVGIDYFKECSKETIENTEIMMVETDWGNAMSLYGTYYGALFTNSWDMLEENWGVIRHAFDYYLHAMDWACMCASYCENGISWNDGTNYGGYLAFVNMAEMLNKEKDLAVGRYAFSKMFAMRAGLFHAAPHYFCKYLGTDPWHSSKFFHEETDASRAFLSYPASKIRNGCRAESLYNITTEGHYKEALDAYCKYMKKEMLTLLDAFRYSLECAPWEERPAQFEDVYHTPDHGFPGWHEVYSFFICCIHLGLMSREELEEKITLAMKNKRLAREMLGHIVWSKRRVPAYWTYSYLLSILYGKDQVKLTVWKNVKIEKALYPELEIIITGANSFIEFKSSTIPHITLNGKELAVKNSGRELWRISVNESGTVKFL